MRILVMIALLIPASIAVPTLQAEDRPAPRLIVRGDDMGYAHAGNEAILKCYREGIETSVEIIAPAPWFPEAAQMLKEHPEVDIGVHLALSSEWDNVKWRPLYSGGSLRDGDGYFFPMIRPNRNYPQRSLLENRWLLADIEQEFRAQIELVKKHVPRVSHVSSHMGCAEITDEVRALVRQLAREYKIDIATDDYQVKAVNFNARLATVENCIDSFIAMLDKLEPGKTYLTVEHPGLDTPELRAIHHIGYENVAEHRQRVTDVWTSRRVRDAIRSRGIKLIGYRDLKRS